MKIVIMGTGSFIVPVFQSLLKSSHGIAHVITRPSRQRNGRPTVASPMRAAAEAAGVPVSAPDTINSEEAWQLLSDLAADLFVVCDYGQILSRATLALATHGGINLHASLLPKYRGAAPINWALYYGEIETGVTVIHMSPRLDAGPCLVQRSVDIVPRETACELEARLALLGVEPVMQAIQLFECHDASLELGASQDNVSAIQAPRLKKSDGLVNWQRSAKQIYNQVRAMKPWPRTYTDWHRAGGESLRIILEEVSISETTSGNVLPGQRLGCDDLTRLEVATGEGVLALDVVQPAGKRAMSCEEFLRGHLVGATDWFGSVACE